ncbi:MAG: pirin family protein [Pseudomonadales bacterium]|nr:pirin family protein [Pseudomonadales bacterium]
MSSDLILDIQPLGFQWKTLDPFLFCVHHQDFYPAGNAQMGPQDSLGGRNIGQDFQRKDGWNMYHGQQVPGFPGHPHRGFETVTIVQKGVVDHADSLGAAGRYGNGDVQWMTAGKGIQHSEMFPLLRQDADNTMELFQVWVNLPAASKLVSPHFTMFWNENMPRYTSADGRVTVDVIAGDLQGISALAPPPDSWAADPRHHLGIWLVRLAAGAEWEMPATVSGHNRSLYFFQGDTLTLAGKELSSGHSARLRPEHAVTLKNTGQQEARLLVLQGQPIGEPVAHYGPFVMNSREELQQAFIDYQRDQFGGWPWPRDDQVHPRESKRFARYDDGREEHPAGE